MTLKRLRAFTQAVEAARGTPAEKAIGTALVAARPVSRPTRAARIPDSSRSILQGVRVQSQRWDPLSPTHLTPTHSTPTRDVMVNRIVPLLGLIVALSGCYPPPYPDTLCETTAWPNGVSVTNVTGPHAQCHGTIGANGHIPARKPTTSCAQMAARFCASLESACVHAARRDWIAACTKRNILRAALAERGQTSSKRNRAMSDHYDPIEERWPAAAMRPTLTRCAAWAPCL
jgi:hypothetical protein